LGKLGWTAYDYYTALPVEFYAACEGYMERQKESALVIRFAAFRVAESMAGSKAVGKIDRFWPIADNEVKPKAKAMTKEQYDEIMKRHGLKIK
jgi:hypothetical protein